MLRELQAAFAATIRAGAAGDVAARLETAIHGGALSVAERLSVYRNNHRLTLAGALAGAYPVLESLLGAECFAQLAGDYVAATPSACGDLHDYGARLAEWIEGCAPLAPWPWFADVARLEWAVHTAYHAAGADGALTLAALAAVPPEAHETLRLRVRPSLRLVASRWPVLDVWAAHQDGAAGRPVDLDAGAQHLLVWRTDGDGGDIAIVPVAAGEWALAQAFADGEPLGAACAAALAADPGCAPGPALGRLLALGVCTGLGA